MNQQNAVNLNELLTNLLAEQLNSHPHTDQMREPAVGYGFVPGNKMNMAQLVSRGVPYQFYEVMQQFVPFTEPEWAELLDISTKSLQRYKQMEKPFKSLQSEKLVEMAEVASAGIDTFGGQLRFNQWLETPNYALGNAVPKQLLRNAYGKELIMGELNRINHGILS